MPFNRVMHHTWVATMVATHEFSLHSTQPRPGGFPDCISMVDGYEYKTQINNLHTGKNDHRAEYFLIV